MHLFYPVLLYGFEIWTTKKNDLKKLVAFEMCCYRKVLNITWKDKICNEDVLLRISSCKSKPWVLSSLLKTHPSLYQIREKAPQKAGTYTYTMSMWGPPGPRGSLIVSLNHSCPGLVMFAEWATCIFPNAFLWKWSRGTNRQGRPRKRWEDDIYHCWQHLPRGL